MFNICLLVVATTGSLSAVTCEQRQMDREHGKQVRVGSYNKKLVGRDETIYAD